jgi:hypothetical protein
MLTNPDLRRVPHCLYHHVCLLTLLYIGTFAESIGQDVPHGRDVALESCNALHGAQTPLVMRQRSSCMSCKATGLESDMYGRHAEAAIWWI